MSDQNLGKKMVEEMQLELFVDAYQHATGQRLGIGGAGERPDFICERPNGEQVGVELTEVRTGFGYISSGVQDVVAAKAEKLNSGDWRLAYNTMLVLIVTWGSLSKLKDAWDMKDPENFDRGFVEVWVADYSGVDAFGNVELFGLFPKAIWGYYRRPNWGSKPYG